MRKKYAVLLLVLLLAVAGCGKKTEPVNVPTPPVQEPAQSENPPAPEPGPTEVCRFCGRLIPEGTALERPLLVIYGNTKPARPPYGLSEACFVYEVPVEGGITRLLAVFGHSFKGSIGPVRSARPYFAVLTLEHKGILAHCGFSPRGQVVLRDLKVAHINEIAYGQFYFRDKDRKAPNNLNTSIELLLQGAARLKYLPVKQKAEAIFKTGQGDYGQGEKALKVSIAYSNATKADYLYEEKAGRYLRSMNGEKHLDAGGTQLCAQNLIVQFVNIVPEEPKSDRLDIALVGQGTGWYFSGGKAYPLTWSKKDAASPAQFKVNGRELLLAEGATWIHMVSNKATKSVSFE